MSVNQQQHQKLQKEMQDEMQQFLAQTIFPAESIPDGFLPIARVAMSYESPKSMNIKTDIFKSILLDDNRKFTLYEMGTIVNAIEGRNMRELNLSAEQYCDTIDMTLELANVWNDMVTPKRNAIDRKMQAKMRIVTPNNQIKA